MSAQADIRETSPFFSIIIPTYLRPEELSACLESLASQNYPKERFEVIVVNDGGTNSLGEVVKPFTGRLGLVLIEQEKAGPAAARNSGAARATGEVLVFTDDDCLPATYWLSSLEKHCKSVPGCLVGGRTINTLSGNIYATASQIINDYIYDYYNRDPENANYFSTNNLAVPKEVFKKVRGFSTAFTSAAAEDREFCYRCITSRHRMVYYPEAIVYHAHKLTLGGFIRQHFKYGKGAYMFRKIVAIRKRKRMRLERPSFYLNLILYPLIKRRGLRSIIISTLLVASQLFITAGFLTEKVSFNNKNVDVR